MLEESLSGSGVFTPVGDDSDTASDNLSWVTFTVELGKTNPFTELLGVRDLDERNVDIAFTAETFNELDVGFFSDRVAENAHNSVSGGKSLGSRLETTGKTVVSKGNAQGRLEGIFKRQFRWLSGFNGNFFDLDFFDVRLFVKL